MPDLDPEIWDNPTLGAAAPNVNLDVVERQAIEDRAAKFEDREPREIVNDNNYPGWTPDVNERTGTVPSNYQTVHFADENPNDIPVDSGRPDEDAGTVTDETSKESSEGPQEGSEDSDVNSTDGGDAPVETPIVSSDEPGESSESNSTQENGTTQWS
jgi:hypothetical protein